MSETSQNMPNANAVRARVRLLTKQSPPDEWELTGGTKGLIVGNLNKTLGGDDNRYITCGWLLRDDNYELRSGLIEDHEWFALWQWVGPWKEPESGAWLVRADFPKEAVSAFGAAVLELYGEDYIRQYEEGRDQMEQVDTAVGELGGQVVEITEESDAPSEVERERPKPSILGITKYHRRQQVAKNLEEVGYDDPDDPIVNF
jgi:hypothetical protein